MLRTILSPLRPFVFAAAAFAVVAAPLPAQTRAASQTIVVPSRIVQPVDDSVRVTLRGYIHPLARAANDRGAAPDSMPLQRIHLVLQRSASQEASLQQLIAGMHTPGNANYHKWLTPAQFGQQFGPSDQDVNTVTSWLASHGFEVTGVKAGKQVIEFNGNVAQMRAAFGTQIHQYQVNGETHYATATEPQIPAALAPVVSGFATLNNFRLKKNSHVLGQASFDSKTHTVKPNWTYGNSSGVNFVVSPQDFGVQYDLPNTALNAAYPTTSPQYNGAGQSVAIINDANINIDLVNQFRTLFGLPANPPTVIIDGNDPGVEGINNPDGPNYDSDEAYIDVEWSGAVAPKASIDMVIAADTDLESGLILAAEDAIYSDIAPVLSLSFGACEASLGSENIFLNQLTEQAAAQGQTFLVSSGDSGSAACDSSGSPFAVQGVAVSGFASTPWDVAVGGTDFYYSQYNNSSAITGQLENYWSLTPSQSPSVSLLQRIPEQPWNDSQYGLDTVNYWSDFGFTTIGGGGGGASSAANCNATTGTCAGGYPKPSWQTGVTGTQVDNVRDVPDVSLFASDGSNYSFYPFCYADGDCQPASGQNLVQISGAGGTSFAAPAFAGIMALVNEAQTEIKGSPQSQGQADFVLYPLKAQFPAAFNDVTVGTNAVPCNVNTVSEGGNQYPPTTCIPATNPITYDGVLEGETGTGTVALYNASAGYNRATGLGSVDAAKLIADWNNVTFKTTSVTLTPSSTSFAHGTAITVSGTVTAPGTPTGNVALMTNSSESGNQGVGVVSTAITGVASTFAVGTNGAYTGSVQDLPGGTYDIWGSYSGDGTNGSSTSPKTSITVTPEASTVYFNLLNSASTTSGSLGISPGSTTVQYGTEGTMDADLFPTTYYNNCVTPTTPPASCSTMTYTPPTGTVTFTDNSTVANIAVVNTEGDAEFDAPYSIGTHALSASYSGDASYSKSTSSTIHFTVVQDSPNLYAGAANGSQSLSNTFIGGQPTVFYVLIENSANSATESSNGVESTTPVLPPTGTVTVTGLPSGSSSGTASLVGSVDPTDGLPAGIAQFTIPASACSSTCNFTLNISYGGDTNYTSISKSGTITIAPPTPTTLLTSTITVNAVTGTITPNSSIPISGTVTGQSGHPAPTGAVYLYPNGDPTTAFSLVPGTGDTSTFTGTLSSQVLTQGGNVLTLYYTGDAVYNSSSVLVNSGTAIPTPLSDFTMTAASSTVGVAAGATGTTTVYVTPTNGFSGTVSLSCAVQGTPNGVNCSVSPGSVTLAYSNTASLTHDHERWNLLATGGGAVLACVLLFTIPARRRAWRNLLSLVVFVCIAGFGIGCGSSSGGTTCNLGANLCGGGGGTGGGTPGTVSNPTQAVTVTITATSGAAAGNYTATITGTAPTDLVHTIGVVAQVQ